MKATHLRVLKALRDYRSASAGNVAILFALAIIPLVGSVGAAIDYSRANWVRTAMQTALDSTVLMISKEAANDTSSQIQANALKYFKSMFTNAEAQNISVSINYSNIAGSSVVGTASATLPALITPVFGFKQFNLSVRSAAQQGNTRLRVALVLDNTGSMAQSGKLDALITATNSLLTQLKNAVFNNGDVYVSIVPFSNAVNLGSANYNQSWIDWTDWDATYGTCSYKSYTSQGTCTSNGKNWTPDNHNTWSGCVWDRGNKNNPSNGNYDQTVDPADPSNLATLYPALPKTWDKYCPQEAAMGLSYDWSAMTTEVNNMTAKGATDQPLGLVWGWRTLVGRGPFTMPALDPNYKYKRVIILLSDGLNTKDRWYGSGSATSTQVDARMDDGSGNGTCANIKADGIEIYTIQVNTGGDPTSTLLQNCASSSPGTTDHFFLLTSAGEIVTTFQAIGTNLTQLYLAQ